VPLQARSLAPLVKTRDFGMTQSLVIASSETDPTSQPLKSRFARPDSPGRMSPHGLNKRGLIHTVGFTSCAATWRSQVSG
jgi:hypothetical protein